MNYLRLAAALRSLSCSEIPTKTSDNRLGRGSLCAQAYKSGFLELKFMEYYFMKYSTVIHGS